MIKLLEFRDTEKLVRLIEKTRGEVFLHLPDHTICNLKKDKAALQMIKIMEPGEAGIRLSFSNPADVSVFVQYMIGGAIFDRDIA